MESIRPGFFRGSHCHPDDIESLEGPEATDLRPLTSEKTS